MPSIGGEVQPEALCHKILRNVKNSSESMNKNTSHAKFIISFARPSYLLPDHSAGRIAKDLWWTNQVSSVDFIQPWLSIPIYHMRDKQYAPWWMHFRDVVSPHRHDQSI
jgi:hypothetical protein